MISIASGTRIFVYTGTADMRKSFNGLSGLVTQHFKADLFESGDEQSSQDESEDDDQKDDSKRKRRRRKKKSEKIPSYLKRKVIEADVSPEQRMCSSVGVYSLKWYLGIPHMLLIG